MNASETVTEREQVRKTGSVAGEVMETHNDIAVEAKDLSKSYDGVPALSGLNLAVRSGELFGLVGPDGAGKTTTIRIFCGILKPTSGKAVVLGRDTAAGLEEVKSGIGYLSQRFSLYGDLTVDENIEFFAGIHGVSGYERRREELLEFTRLAPFRRRLADRLSGGMKQKLGLACALIHTPRLLLLDEPTTGVDPVSRRDFWKILSGLLRSGVTIILTTPYMDEAERCGRVGFIAGGLLLAVDTPFNIRRLMRGYVLEVNTGDNRRARGLLKGLASVRSVQLFGDRVNIVADDAEEAAAETRRSLAAAGIDILELKVVPPSLENVFISVAESHADGAAYREAGG